MLNAGFFPSSTERLTLFFSVHYYCFECTRNYLLLISGGLHYIYFLAVSRRHHYSYCSSFILHGK